MTSIVRIDRRRAAPAATDHSAPKAMFVLGLVASAIACACAGAPTAPAPDEAAGVARDTFNYTAVTAYEPVFWLADRDSNGRPAVSEVAWLWRSADDGADRGRPSDGIVEAAIGRVIAIAARPDSAGGLDIAEAARRRAVLAELKQGRVTVIATDLRDLGAREKAMVGHLLQAAIAIERLHAMQRGSRAAWDSVTDPPSRALIQRNQQPWCGAAQTESDPTCRAVTAAEPRAVGVYPVDLQGDTGFCATLSARPDAAALLAPFVAVRRRDGALVAVPYTEAWPEAMNVVAVALEAAAADLEGGDEVPLQAYLRAAAGAFRSNDWNPADEAWAAMDARSSRWYLRIAPDETYWEPCSRKAGFHMTFARIDQASLAWQARLEPVKQDMENTLATLAGPPYLAREVSFHLPDFIEIVLNAGEARSALGAIVGQSLPNWGPVANEGRGRTVAMTNIGTDADSRAAARRQINSLLCADSAALVPVDTANAVRLGTVLHEAAHNLGPAAEYRVGGKVDEEWFGGPLAAMLEELKAQTAALYLADWLVERGVLKAAERDASHATDMVWAFGQVAQELFDGRGKPKPYPQLAAIQVGTLMAEGALAWRARETAANGRDTGCMHIDLARFPPVTAKLMAQVAGIKARGDRAAADALTLTHVRGDSAWTRLHALVQERWRREPRASFVYSLRF